MNRILDDLINTELFKGVPREFLAVLAAKAEFIEADPGTVLLTPEQENRHLYLILSGTLSVHFESPDTPVIRTIEAGLSVGELSVIMDGRPSAYVVVQEKSRLLRLEREVVWKLVDTCPAVSRNLLAILVRWILSNTERIIEDREQIDELSAHAMVDGLTGLFNRRWLDDTLARMLKRGQEDRRPLCVIMTDVDHFKKYNDSQGHLGGDQALVALAMVMKRHLRPSDFATRYGGEEFMILMPDTTLEEGVMVAERLRREAERKEIVSLEGKPLPGITISMGIAASDPDSTPESLTEKADRQLYRAKSEGRNRCCG